MEDIIATTTRSQNYGLKVFSYFVIAIGIGYAGHAAFVWGENKISAYRSEIAREELAKAVQSRELHVTPNTKKKLDQATTEQLFKMLELAAMEYERCNARLSVIKTMVADM